MASSVAVPLLLASRAAQSSTPVAAPWIILVEGERAGTRTVFSDWQVNLRLMLSIAQRSTLDARTLTARPSLRVALFWGPEWQGWRAARIDPETLSFDRANQHAQLYRATDSDRPVWVFGSMSGLTVSAHRDRIREIDSSGVALLMSHGVPVAALR